MKITDCKPGMVLASDIVNDYGAVILYQNSKLDEFYISKLIRLGLKYVKVYRNYEFKEKKHKVIEAQFNNNMEEFKQIIWNMNRCGELDINRICRISKNLSDNFESVNDLISFLGKVRSVNEYIYKHSLNVSLLCSLLGSWLNLGHKHIEQLSYCGLLHDIGKTRISSDIINKPDQLTEEEFEEIKKHPVIGYKMLRQCKSISEDVTLGILMHHEREDGSGYPLGLKSKQIHGYAKILAVADVFDAMTSNRVYKKRQPPFDVLEMFESEYLSKCDARIMLTFLKRISSYYIGNIVKLNNGKIGEIVYINPNRISRPLIKVNDEIIDLSAAPELRIVEMK